MLPCGLNPGGSGGREMLFAVIYSDINAHILSRLAEMGIVRNVRLNGTIILFELDKNRVPEFIEETKKILEDMGYSQKEVIELAYSFLRNEVG